LSRQRYKSGAGNSGGYNHHSTSHHLSTETEWLSSRHLHSTTNSSSKISKDSNATTPNLVGAYESGPSTVRYVYRPPSFEPSTRMTSIHRASKEYGNPQATSVGSCTHSARHQDKENGKSQYQENETKLKPPSNALSTIVVSPGHEARLRGAAETWQAIQQDFYLPCVCLDCEAFLFCILDAWLVLCPHCRVINPICHNDHGDMAANPDRGVGLGFTKETLMEAQANMWSDF
jgi:hypothetical protein